jgi:hypothetical protein
MGTELVKASNHKRELTNRRSSFTLPAVIDDEAEKAAARARVRHSRSGLTRGTVAILPRQRLT